MEKIGSYYRKESLPVLGISRMTVHNGPGIRTLLQLKGCPLGCLWCSTPESQSPHPQLTWHAAKCIGCHGCVKACPRGALSPQDKAVAVNWRLCDHCGACTQACYAQALIIQGVTMPVEDIYRELLRDEPFYQTSKGGVTISGGEPLLHIGDGLISLLKKLRGRGITVGIDTSGYAQEEALRKILPYVSFFLWDLKVMDPLAHRQYTGADNALILMNLRAADAYGSPLYIRCPVIRGFTDGEENLTAMCRFLQSLSHVEEVHLLPMHHLGKARYASMGLPYPIQRLAPFHPEELLEKKELVEAFGFQCRIEG